MEAVKTISPTDYLTSVMRTANKESKPSDQIENCLISLQGEWGEIANYVKKCRYHGKQFDPAVFIDEFGDILFYCFWLCKIVDPNFDGKVFSTIMGNNFNYYDNFFHKDLRISRVTFKIFDNILSLNSRCFVLISNSDNEIHPSSLTMSQIQGSCGSLIKHLAAFGAYLKVDSSVSEVALKNIKKLEKRYPSGFSVKDSENRRV